MNSQNKQKNLTNHPRYQQKQNKKVAVPQATPQVELNSKKDWSKKWDWLFACLVFVFSFCLYVNSYHNNWVLDDYGAYKLNLYVTRGADGYKDIMTKTYRHGSGFYTDNLYRPLSQIMFATEWQLFHDAQRDKEDKDSLYMAHYSHLVNVIFYALSCVLLYVLMRKLFNRQNLIIPLLITLFYAAQTMHTETVANIKGRDDIMSLFFILASMIFMLNYVDAKKMAGKIGNWIGIFISFLLAFFSKESAITMLVAMPLMMYFFRNPKIKDFVSVFVALLIPAGIYLGVRFAILKNYPTAADGFTVSVMDHYYYDLWKKDIASYWATAIMLMGKYLVLAIFPYQQVCDYSYSQLPVCNLWDWSGAYLSANLLFVLSALVHIGLLFYAVMGIKKKNPVAYGILFYLCVMSIFCNIIMRIGSSFADRFLFLPTLGTAIAMVCFLFRILKIDTSVNPENEENRFSLRHGKTAIVLACCAIFIGFCSFKTVKRSAEWIDQFTLFGADVKKSDNSAHMRLYWGLALRDKGLACKDRNDGEKDWNKIQENNKEMCDWLWQAAEHFKRGVEIYPGSADCNEQLGIVYENLYPFYPDKAYRDTAEKYYLRALAIVPSKAATNSNIAKIYFDRGEIQKAKSYYLEAVKWDALFADAYFNLGSCYGMLQMYDSSFYYYNKCLEYQPDRADCFVYMGLNYANTKNFEKAIEMYEQGISRNRYLHSAYILEAKTNMLLDRWGEARNVLARALDANPFNGEAYFVLGIVDNHEKQIDKALADYLKCIELQPEFAEAYIEVGRIYMERKQPDKAKPYWDEAFRLKPSLFKR